MKNWNKIGAGLLCAFVLTISLGYLLPDRPFSTLERRYLDQRPKLTAAKLLDGSWAEAVEDHLADQMLGRDFFVGLNAYFERLLGLQKAKTIWTLDGKLVRRPVSVKDGIMEKNIGAVDRFAESVEAPVSLALIPSCGFSLGAPEYEDDRLIGELYGMTDLETIDLREVFRGRPDLYYSTDHHWTSAGAFEAYKALVESWGEQPQEAYTVERFSHFRGANYAASGLWLTPAETLEMWSGARPVTVWKDNTAHDGVFYRERLEGYDPYMVFLDGNQPMVRLHDPQGTGKLLVIRDSFASSLAGFLSQSYEDVILVDLRHYNQSVSALAQELDVDRILVLYSLENFLTDTKLVLLK